MGRPSEKDTVEDHKSISTAFLKGQNYFKYQGYISGNIRWMRGEQETGSMGIIVNNYGDYGTARFVYSYSNGWNEEKEDLSYEVQLTTTVCHFGGRRWWFICPLVKNGLPCNRRVGVLYLAGKYAGCRQCYELNYQSSKDSHKLDKIFQKMGFDPKVAKRMLKRSGFDG